MFLNCTAHELTPEQITFAKEYSSVIVDLKTDNKDLHNKLVNCPSEIEAIQDLATELFDYIFSKYRELIRNMGIEDKDGALEDWQILGKKRMAVEEKLIVHFPIGSPAFMAVFFTRLNRELLPVRILFSHSDRVSVDEKRADGSVVKRAIFKFVKYLEI